MITVDPLASERWRNIRRLTDRPSSYTVSWFEPGEQNFESIQNARVLVIGAGGLGCEILKNLALSGFRFIDVIDMDTIDYSNLNRQFLFRSTDVGKSKAEVAAKFIVNRVQGCQVTPHNCRIEDKAPSFYSKFSIIICGLDSITARRWINSTICGLVKIENGQIDPTSIIPIIDGGTEGFKGNSRVIYPMMTACIDCTLDLFPPQVNYPLCTIAHTPRLPEHCIEYIKVILWEEMKPFDGEALNADDPEHVNWVLEKAQKRAEVFGIRGVDRRLTTGVLKRIIPAVASTNAAIAASCVLEALKLVSNVSYPINNYVNFTQIIGAFTGVVSMQRDENCPTCRNDVKTVTVKKNCTIEQLIEILKEKYQLENPNIESSTRKIYVINELLPQFTEESKANLKKNVTDLIGEKEVIIVTDSTLSNAITIVLLLQDD